MRMSLSVDSETCRPEAKAEVIELRNHQIGRVDVMVCAEDIIHGFEMARIYGPPRDRRTWGEPVCPSEVKEYD